MTSPRRPLNWHSFATKEEAEEELASAIAKTLQAASSRQGKAVLSLSGGRSPLGMMRKLAFSIAPWSNTTILLVDDRETDKWDTPRSNAGLIQHTFKDTPASMAKFIPLVPEGARASSLDETGPDPELAAILKTGSDAMVLGMGEDGHFASLFPQADRLEEAFDLQAEPGVLPITAPGADEPRITQNFAAINAAGALYLTLFSSEKHAVFMDIMEDRKPGTPMGRMLQTDGPALEIYTVPKS